MRDPRQVYARYGRQLLVSGVEFDGQARLHALALVVGSDGSAVCAEAAHAAALYLVGAGVGRVVIDAASHAALRALDPDVALLAGVTEAIPPLAHIFFAQRAYGASVEVALSDSAAGWSAGLGAPARVATLRYAVGAALAAEDAVALGAFAADAVLADVLGVEALPAALACDLGDAEAPSLQRRSGQGEPSAAAPCQDESALLTELRASPGQLDLLLRDCQQRYPDEACGLILREAGGALRVQPAENLQNRYHDLEPQTFERTARAAFLLDQRLIQRAADQGLQLVAIYHSHCDAGAYFSAEDVRGAAPGGEVLYPDVAHLVVSVMGGQVKAVRGVRVGGLGS